MRAVWRRRIGFSIAVGGVAVVLWPWWGRWWPGVVGVGVVWLMVRLPMPRPRNGFPGGRDPRRLFTRTDRAWIMRCAGGRCEHRLWGVFRCRRREGLELDHHWPHALGGATVRGNLVLLCRRHNGRKSDRRPTVWSTMLLRRARRRYFPVEDLSTGLDLSGRA